MQETLILTEKYREEFDKTVNHPIQSWAWGEFKRSIGAIPERIGFFENGKMFAALQIIFSKIPKTKYTIGYAAKGVFSDKAPITLQKDILKILAKKHNAIFIKLEPDFCLSVKEDNCEEIEKIFIEKEKDFLAGKIIRGKHIFTLYDFHLNLNKSEEELTASFHSKTRYNIRLAEKKGVTVIDKSSEEGMEDYIRLMEETTKRQGFFNHNASYFKKMFKILPKEQLRIFEAVYNGEVLTAWILFNFNGKLYYPYGASSNNRREVMPNNLIMWKAIQYGKNTGCSMFDLWGSLGPKPEADDPWIGFHKFKAGYNPTLVKYIGAYDFIYKPVLYKLFNAANKIRWKILRKKKK
ncbi:lipid II:glycine glycyltransferase FemX [Treponema pedis]|uniref:Peptidoglycan bridge formation glycyltransferase FemA/FemB family protein n=1 Tax=Treponema pedis TaxID=409322 RepID=A0A7S7AVS2_9SPIR|nr:peptidoglycan bridge formation glycyltransferase FemA/FemB family protein [Treponema pedis]QOW60127.1 peptidoglycan bridge formation glycyltransferase FemA/FemB family protein [Treponema pedis]QSI05474.1 peptidoglycan bridge formation glycyltransferase FemA/FemB family protein [Treponema pedis]